MTEKKTTEKYHWPEYTEIENRLMQYSPAGSGRMTAAELLYIFNKSEITPSEYLYDIAALAYEIGYSKAKQIYENVDQNAALDLMDTGILNEPMGAYFTVAMHRAGLDQDTQRAIMDSLHVALDNYTANEVMEVSRQIR